MENLKMVRIWDGDVRGGDRYVAFKSEFKPSGGGSARLAVACDGIFTCRMNGELVAFGACQNYPGKYPYQLFEVDEQAKTGGELEIVVWHQGVTSSTTIDDDAFLAFRLEANGEVLAESGAGTLCAEHGGYVGGSKRWITGQLGYSYVYDFNGEGGEVFEPATEYGEVDAYPWELCADGKRDQILLEPAAATLEKTDFGYLADMGRETVGYLLFEAECDKPTTVTVTYGEHLRDGRVPRIIDWRDFSAEFRLKPGKNVFCGEYRRFAGRYLEAIGEGFTTTKLTLLPVERDVKIKKREFENPLDQKIYDTCVRTLVCSMHDHYEDCPWREQALYVLDSRNQMLSGYYAFEGFEFARENLRLMAKGLYGHGLLALTFPCVESRPIPFFSLAYPVAVSEYIKYSGDREILGEVGDVVKTIMRTFKDKIEDNGLIASFPYPCWNFYEWTEGSGNDSDLQRKPTDPFTPRFDLILNCAYVVAAKAYDELFGASTDCEATVQGIKSTFFDSARGVFKLSTINEASSVLGNSLAILAGAGDEKLAEKLTAGGDDIIPVTLSTSTYFYDALLGFGDRFKDFVLSDIRAKYGYMLEKGATTFWETISGAEDFNGAGSLCHGWSAIPAYYLCLLSGKKA